MEDETYNEVFKSKLYSVVFIGAANVGKTALVYRYVLDELPPGLTSTVAVEFTKRPYEDRNSGLRYQLHIWDTAGQERFKSVTKHHYRGADACMLVFDISNRESFAAVPNWLSELRDNTSPECVVCLVANKSDLDAKGHRVVSREEAQRFAKKNRMLYHETSSFWARERSPDLTQMQCGVDFIFRQVIATVLSSHTAREELPSPLPVSEKNRGVKLDPQQLYSYHADNKCTC
jgi:small GTP-binding protein